MTTRPSIAEMQAWCGAPDHDEAGGGRGGVVRIEVRQCSAMSTYLVTIQDKALYGEPDVALAIVEAPDEEAAIRVAHPTIMKLIDRGRCRCVPHARLLEPGKFYRLGAVVRLPHDPNAEEPYDPEIKKKEDACE